MGARYKAMLSKLERQARDIAESVCLCPPGVPALAERIGRPDPGEERDEVCPDCGGLRCQAEVPYYEILSGHGPQGIETT